eukprot:2493753-Rhodomonas_salina.1
MTTVPHCLRPLRPEPGMCASACWRGHAAWLSGRITWRTQVASRTRDRDLTHSEARPSSSKSGRVVRVYYYCDYE